MKTEQLPINIKETIEHEKSFEKEKHPLTIDVYKNPESAANAVAAKLLEKIKQKHEKEFKIGISHGDALNQVMGSFVDQIKELTAKGESVDFSKVKFIQMEALFPESKESPVNKFAYALEQKLVKPLKDIGININMYYPGESGKSFEETLRDYKDLISDLDIDMVSVNTSGDARAFRDANIDPRTGEAEYVLGSPKYRDVVVRPFAYTDYDSQKDKLKGKVFERPPGDMPSGELFKKLDKSINKAIESGDTTTKKSEYLITEGIRTYKRAGEVWIITSGEKKQTAVKRMFKNTKIGNMPEEERKRRRLAAEKENEGKTSTAAIIETREGFNTWVVLDEAAVGNNDFDNIQNYGVDLNIHEQN